MPHLSSSWCNSPLRSYQMQKEIFLVNIRFRDWDRLFSFFQIVCNTSTVYYHLLFYIIYFSNRTTNMITVLHHLALLSSERICIIQRPPFWISSSFCSQTKRIYSATPISAVLLEFGIDIIQHLFQFVFKFCKFSHSFNIIKV